MCLAVPGRIICRDGDSASVDVQGNRFEVSLVLTPEAKPREWVLIHAGFSIAVLDEWEARQTWTSLQSMTTDEIVGALADEPPLVARRETPVVLES